MIRTLSIFPRFASISDHAKGRVCEIGFVPWFFLGFYKIQWLPTPDFKITLPERVGVIVLKGQNRARMDKPRRIA